MGGFYGSIQVKTTDRAAVKAAAEAVMAARKMKCLLGPELNGWVGIYPEGHGQDDSVGREIAERVGGFAMHVLVHDDDILAYWLWSDGRLMDRYHSSPGYFGDENLAEEEPLIGNAKQFAFVLDEVGQKKLAKLIDREAKATFEVERLEKLGKVLGIQNLVAAYEYLKDGERDEIKGWRQFEEIPVSRAKLERTQRQAAINLIKENRKSLKKSGVLLFSDKRNDQMAVACSAGNGLMIVWPVHGRGVLSINRLSRPWEEVLPAGIESPSHITAVVSTRDSQRMAFAAGDRIRIWDFSNDGWRHLVDIPEGDLAIGAAISLDGRTIAHASRNEIVISEIPSGRRLFAVPPRDQRQMAFHPSGKWVACAGHKLGLISLESEPRIREILVGGRSSPGIHLGPLREQIAKIDLNALEKKKLTSLDEEIAKLRSAQGNSKGPALSEAQMETARQAMLKSIEMMLTRMRAIQSGDVSALGAGNAQGKESVRFVGFTNDGKYLFCGTNIGLRIYDWESFSRESESVTPSPKWTFDPPGGGAVDSHRSVNAIVEEPDGKGLVFGGWTGKLMRLDLGSGDVEELVNIPGGGGIYSLAFSSCGEVLAVCSQFSRVLNRESLLPDANTIEVWAYPALRDSGNEVTRQ